MPNENQHRSLSLPEKIGLISGIIGLITDGIALITFIANVWGVEIHKSPSPGIKVFYITSGLIIFYGWLTLSWILARRGLNFIPLEQRRKNLNEIVQRDVIGIGLVLSPLYIVWLIAMVPQAEVITIAIVLGYPAATGFVYLSTRFLLGLIYPDLTEYF